MFSPRFPLRPQWIRAWPVWLSLALALLVIVLFPDLHHTDYLFWHRWSNHLHRHGLLNAYVGSNINYPPLGVYVLYGLNQFLSVERAIQYFKLLPLLFDFLGPLLAVWVLRRSLRTSLTGYWPTFSLAFLANTLVWGQIDSVHTTLAFGAILLALNNRWVWSVTWLALALLVKAQAIIFLPLLGVVLLPSLRSASHWLRLIGAFTGTVLVVCLPFLFKPTGLGELWRQAFASSVGLYPTLNSSASNLWEILFGAASLLLSDTTRWGGVSFRFWGLALFVLSSTLVLLPVLRGATGYLRRGISRYANPARNPLTPLVLLAGGAIPVFFFFFNTQMHERYAHPALLFLYAYGLSTGRYTCYLLVSVLYLANLTQVMTPWLFTWFFGEWATPAIHLFSRGVGLGYAVLVGLLLREMSRAWAQTELPRLVRPKVVTFSADFLRDEPDRRRP